MPAGTIPFRTSGQWKNIEHHSVATPPYRWKNNPSPVYVSHFRKTLQVEVFFMEEKKEQQKKSGDFGADPDEQAINGDYGMLETEEEDKKD